MARYGSLRKRCFPAKRTVIFTLIELLVSIAIIAIMASLILPTLGNARNVAKNIKCISNQKQIIAAMVLYAGDSNDALPIGAVVGFGGMAASWDRAIASYLGVNLIDGESNGAADVTRGIPAMECPADNGKRATGRFIRSYALNAIVDGGEADKAAAAGCPVFGGGYIGGIATYCAASGWGYNGLWAARLGKTAGNTIMAADYHNPGSFIGGDGGSGLFGLYEFDTSKTWNTSPHNRKISFGYCDGHAEARKLADTFGAGGTWGQPRGEWTSFGND